MNETGEQAAEQGAVVWVDKVTYDPCPTRSNPGGGMILCTVTDPAHRHVAEHMLPPLSLAVVPGSEPVSALGMVEALDRVLLPGQGTP